MLFILNLKQEFRDVRQIEPVIGDKILDEKEANG